MEYDALFRTIMIASLAIVFPFAFYYRLMSNLGGEKLDRMQEGLFILIGLRVFAGIAFAALFAYLIDPEYMRWSSFEAPLWLRVVGVILGALGAILWIMTFRYLGKNLTDTVIVREKATLVTTGPYRYVRHPFYLAFMLIILANALAAANWFILISGLAAFFFIYLRIPKEEARLIERFGDSYTAYMKKTPRFGI